MARAGIMQGRKCCVHWYHRNEFEQEFPKIQVDSDTVYVEDKDRITCLGGRAAVDVALFLIERHCSAVTACKVVSAMVIEQMRGERSPQQHAEPAWFGEIGNPLVRRAIAVMDQSLTYGGYTLFVIWCFNDFGESIINNFKQYPVNSGWFIGGISYAGYNLAAIPAVLFCLRHISTRKQAIAAGLLAGPLAMNPALLFFIAMIGFYPLIGEQPVPIHFLLTQLDAVIFPIVFQIILFGTFIETGTAMIHSFNERVAHFLQERNQTYPAWIRSATEIFVLTCAIYLASEIGLIGLIGAGYGTLTWVFIILIVLPLLTTGLWKIIKAYRVDNRD